jgi:hypothetical protein
MNYKGENQLLYTLAKKNLQTIHELKEASNININPDLKWRCSQNCSTGAKGKGS